MNLVSCSLFLLSGIGAGIVRCGVVALCVVHCGFLLDGYPALAVVVVPFASCATIFPFSIFS